VTTYVGKAVPKNVCGPLLRIYLMERTHKLLSKEAREAIEDFAWELLTKYPLGMSRDTVEKAELAHFLLPNNGQTDKWRRYFLALEVVRKAGRYGPTAKLEGDTIENHYQAWDRFLINFFHIFPNEGTDMDIAHPSSYGECTVGVFYDLFDLADDPELRRLCVSLMEIERWGMQNRITRCLESLARYGGAAKPLLPQLRQMEKDLRTHREAKSLQSQIERLGTIIKNIESASGTVELRCLN
jgi:hypothetical protein